MLSLSEEKELRKQNKAIMYRCRGCRHLHRIEEGYLICDYAWDTGHLRPCPIENCTVKDLTEPKQKRKRKAFRVKTVALGVVTLILMGLTLWLAPGESLATSYKIEAQRSGFDFERTSDETGEEHLKGVPSLVQSARTTEAADAEIPETVTEETAPMWELTLERHEARRCAGYKPETAPAVKMEYLGRYWITGYDACKACCGKTDGITASGTKAAVGRTCAAPKGFGFGERLYIDGLGERVVEDRGGAIKGSKIDVFCADHPECYAITGWYDVYRIVEG